MADVRKTKSDAERDPMGSGRSEASDFSRFTRRAAVAIGLAVFIVVVLFFFWTIAKVLLLFFAGVLLAVLLRGAARGVSRRTPLPYGWSLLVVIVLIVGVVTLVGNLIAPQVSAQFKGLTETIPQAVGQLEGWLQQQEPWGPLVLQRVPDSPGAFVDGQQGIWSRATGIVSRLVEVLGNLLVVIVSGIYLAATPDLYRRGIVRLVPRAGRARAREVLHAVGEALWHWLTAQAISMTLIGVLTWLGLTLLGIPLALALGLIAGVLEFVPIIGPLASTVPAVLIALLEGPQAAVYVLLLFLGIQQLESNVVTPLVMKGVVSLPPVLTLAATIVAGVLFGLPGVLLATPLLVVLKVLVEKLYIEDLLGDRGEGVEREA